MFQRAKVKINLPLKEEYWKRRTESNALSHWSFKQRLEKDDWWKALEWTKILLSRGLIKKLYQIIIISAVGTGEVSHQIDIQSKRKAKSDPGIINFDPQIT